MKVHSVAWDYEFMKVYKGEWRFYGEMHGYDDDDDTLSAFRARDEV